MFLGVPHPHLVVRSRRRRRKRKVASVPIKKGLAAKRIPAIMLHEELTLFPRWHPPPYKQTVILGSSNSAQCVMWLTKQGPIYRHSDDPQPQEYPLVSGIFVDVPWWLR
jgi:hypothetical protein